MPDQPSKPGFYLTDHGVWRLEKNRHVVTRPHHANALEDYGSPGPAQETITMTAAQTDKTPGWKIRAVIDTTNPDNVRRISDSLSRNGLKHVVDEAGTLTVHTSAPGVAMAAAEEISSRFNRALQRPTDDMIKQGMQAAPRVWTQFSAGKDPRFESYGTAGVPFLKTDAALLNSPAGTQVAIDTAVMNSNRMLTHHYAGAFTGRTLEGSIEAPSHGWVLSIHTSPKNVLNVASHLSQDGVQNRIARDITQDAQGRDLSTIVAYAGSWDKAESIARSVSKLVPEQLAQNAAQPIPERYQLSRGIEAHFVPDVGERLVIDQTRPYIGGLPRIRETDLDTGIGADERFQRSAQTMAASYGEYFTGSFGHHRIHQEEGPRKMDPRIDPQPPRDYSREGYKLFLQQAARSHGDTVENVLARPETPTLEQFRAGLREGKNAQFVEMAEKRIQARHTSSQIHSISR